MRFLTRMTAAVAVRAATASAAAVVSAKPGSGTPRESRPQATQMSTLRDEPTRRHAGLEERQAQKPLIGCPEMFGDDPMPCYYCEGEAPDRKGYCKYINASGWQCQCRNVNENGSTTTVITTTVGSDVATGTYELDEMTDYPSLRQRITITTTVPATSTTSGGNTAATVVVVVLAAGVGAYGVAWFLGYAGGGAAAVAALEPPSEAENHEDDKKCPDPKKKCKDCGSEKDVCKTGDATGCACDEEEDNCPKEDSEKDICTDDEKCDADNEGKCTVGEHKECDCKKPDCPDPKAENFQCDICGGKGLDGKCNGITDEAGGYWQGCACLDGPVNSNDLKLAKPADTAKHQKSIDDLPKKGASKPPPDNGSPDDSYAQTCADTNTYKPFKRSDAESKWTEFCKDGITLPTAAQRVWRTYRTKDYSLQIWTQWAQSGQTGCADYTTDKMTADQCKKGFASGVDLCNTDTQDKKYGSKPVTWKGTLGCVDFNIYADGADWECPGGDPKPIDCPPPARR